MKALLSKTTGGPETLVYEDVASPEVRPGFAVISTKAVGINFPDVLMIEDKYQMKPPRPFSPGGELSGVVKAIGEGVTNVKVGDRILANTGWGGLAEEVLLPANRLWHIPDSMPHDVAAAFILTYGTSYHALKDRGHLKAGDTMLVLGAAGGVGLSAVELGKAMGARVVAACSSQEKCDLAIKHGADEGIVYGRGPFDRDGQKALGQLFKDAGGAEGFNVIYDAVGGGYAEPALRSIAWEGRYLVIGFAAGDIPKIPLNLTLLKGCDIVGVFWGTWTTKNPELFAKSVDELLELYAQGKVKPHVSERFPLSKGADAIAHLGSRKAMGKVVVTVD
ncbi:MAG: NADPH:quinone oxidoreductase family protein [Phenylobacterium sp.]|jgi:NADPH2:quinone reductase|uniref:NADPH:quinone oxidoreductase family protein n=1 Tax=Phenylobacterium sp. TaxID=1871053 RepID=UPI001B5214C6|nr:NADPH:quinone oxidoreductase family protein [Phenylobacterium sp.]MBP7817633.1 NADPH:quinone oxidoreductase family protein [Phenylobacterium sp.]MBP9230932.1 NADPH:quinone oxidoreductase family protein [Phenylobacterium sp.]MBP9756567.1 NADPH:quinone oxidoreductase family protein [Phenylobacterium sp.]